MANFEQTTPQRSRLKQFLLPAVFGLVLLCALGWFGGYFSAKHRASAPPIHRVAQQQKAASDQPSVQSAEPGLEHIAKFDFLRDVSFMGTQCLVLRHQHTAQRIIVLSSDRDQEQIYNVLFSRELGVPEFSTLIPIFKAGTQFEGSTIEVSKVRLNRQGVLVHAPYRMVYKHYLISIQQDKKPKHFETYIGRINQNNHARALVMTFNTANYGTMEPFQDLLANLKPLP